MNFFLTGASGFVGKNFIEFFQKEHEIKIYNRGSKIDINEDVVIHFVRSSLQKIYLIQMNTIILIQN